MNLSPSVYAEINGLQMRDGYQQVSELSELFEGKSQEIKILVDAGCGNGDTTRRLAKLFPTAQVLAFDIDPHMVRHARNASELNRKLKEETVGKQVYVTEDLGRNWDDWRPELRKVEGLVDMVWSNYAIHWVPVQFRQQAVTNLAKLLSPGGIFCCNIFLLRSTNELNSKLKTLSDIPSMEEQVGIWKKYFENCGVDLCLSKIKVVQHLWTGVVPNTDGTFDDVNCNLNLICEGSKAFMSANLSEEEKDAVVRASRDLLYQDYVTLTHDGQSILTYDAVEIVAVRV